MPDADGKRTGSKSDNGLKNEKPANFVYHDGLPDCNGDTAEAVRRACCLSFNNFLHKAQLMTKPTEQNSSDGLEPEQKRTRNNSGESDQQSDLVLLSVILNKKQKENDEVTMAIERLRQNGVNCLIFKMSDIRNGHFKAASNYEGFRSTNNLSTPRLNSLLSTCSCGAQNTQKPDDALETSILPRTETISSETQERCELVVNLSPTPSPSPPPQPEMHSVENDRLLDMDESTPPLKLSARRKYRRKKYPYSIRKPSSHKRSKPNLSDSNCKTTDLNTKLEKDTRSAEITLVPQATPPLTTDYPGSTAVTLDSGKAELESHVIGKNDQLNKRKGRKSKKEKFEEAFQIAVESFVETTRKRQYRSRHHVPIPGISHSMYTRSSSSNAATAGESAQNLTESAVPSIASTITGQVTTTSTEEIIKAKRGRPRKLKVPDVKAICIRNIFIGTAESKNTPENSKEWLDNKSSEVEPSKTSVAELKVKSNAQSLNTDKSFRLQNHLAIATPTHTLSNSTISGLTTKPLNSSAAVAESKNSFQSKKIDKDHAVTILQCSKNPLAASSPGNIFENPAEVSTSAIEVGEIRNGLKTKIPINQDVNVRTTQALALSSSDLISEAFVENGATDNRKRRCSLSPDIVVSRKKKVITSMAKIEEQNILPAPAIEHATCNDNHSEKTLRLPTPPPPEVKGPMGLDFFNDLNHIREVKETLNALISSVVFCAEMKLTLPESRGDEWDGMPDIRKQIDSDQATALQTGKNSLSDKPPVLDVEGNVQRVTRDVKSEGENSGNTCFEDSLPDAPDSMQLRRSSFYSLVTGNVRVNLDNYLDGKVTPTKSQKRKKRIKNGFLLHHGDNCPENPESPYKLHLATQVLLKLNRRRSKCKQKEERTKNILSYLKLTPKRPVRGWRTQAKNLEEEPPKPTEESVFSGEWVLPKKYVCGVCGQAENCFWDMVNHKGEEHPGVVVTHVEFPPNEDNPPSLIRKTPNPALKNLVKSPECTKCAASFSTLPDLHSHIFECAGNLSWLVEKTPTKRKGRRRGFKRRLSNTPKKQKRVGAAEGTKRRSSNLHKCAFCIREFKTEGWLKNHLSSHSLPISIPLDKLPLASLPSRACSKRSTNSSYRQLRNSTHPPTG